MRFYGLVLIAGAAVLGACSGGEKGASTTDTAASATTAQPSAGATTAAAATVTAAPVTGTWHEVKMIGDEKGYRFEPADLTIKQGDGIKFVMVSGAPHNVAFDPATIPADVKAQLEANMPGQKIGELSGLMLMNANETYDISFANIKPGTYDFHCTPHLALGMKGKVTVQ